MKGPTTEGGKGVGGDDCVGGGCGDEGRWIGAKSRLALGWDGAATMKVEKE